MNTKRDQQHRAWCTNASCDDLAHRIPKKQDREDKPKHCTLCNLNTNDPEIPFACPSIPVQIRKRRIAEREAGLAGGQHKSVSTVVVNSGRHGAPWGLQRGGRSIVQGGR